MIFRNNPIIGNGSSVLVAYTCNKIFFAKNLITNLN